MTAHISLHNWNEVAGRRIGEKTFVNTCHFQMKQVPVKYRETMVLQVNSTKRRFYESIYYEYKMVPSHWSQTMYVDLQPTLPGERIMSEINIPCNENYVSLIPQQVNAETKMINCGNYSNAHDANSCTKNINKSNQHNRVGRAEIYDEYHKSTCEEFLKEMRKMY